MNEMVKFWLIYLYEREIEEAKENLKNHKLWLLGAKNREEEIMETENIANIHEYIRTLTELKENLEKQ